MELRNSIHHRYSWRRLLRVLVILFFGLSGISSLVSAAGNIEGKVSDRQTGEPLAGANVRILGTNLETVAGPDGHFSFLGIPSRLYQLRVSYIGYKTLVRKVAVHNLDSISGLVVDTRTGKPLADIEVRVKGSTLTTTTARDGSFLFEEVPPGTYSLEVAATDYKPLENSIVVGVTEVNFEMNEDYIRSQDVVVTGIAGSTRRAVSEVSVANLETPEYTAANSYAGVAAVLVGKIPGLQLEPASGNVGGGYRFHVRSGAGLLDDRQPLVYLDGIRIDAGEVGGVSVGGQGISLLSDISPEEIEDIQILKGPAAAVTYGASGANGVILISTRRGHPAKSGREAMRFDYQLRTGWNQKATAYSAADRVSAGDANDLFRTGLVVENNVSVHGGSKGIRYFTALNSRVEEGILATNRMNRRNVRANFDFEPNDRMFLRVSSSYTLNTLERPLNDNTQFGNLFNVTARPGAYAATGGSKSALENVRDENKTNRFTGSVDIRFRPAPYLSAHAVVGIDDHDLRQEQAYPANESYSDSLFDAGTQGVANRDGRQITARFDGLLHTRAGKPFTLSLLGGVEFFDSRVRLSNGSRAPLAPPAVKSFSPDAEALPGPARRSHERQVGVFAVANLTYRDIYSVSLRARRDDASAIGRRASAPLYGGLGFGWRLDSYPWLPRAVSLFKLRAAYGESGVLPEPGDRVDIFYGKERGGYGEGTVPVRLGNPNIEPERIKEFEAGFDAELLHRFAFEVTGYYQKSEDAILAVLQAPSTGLTATPTPRNLGSAKGWGFETAVRGRLLHSRSMDISFLALNSWQDNEVLSLGGAYPVFDRFGLNVIKEGLARHEFYLEPVAGARFNPDGTYTGPEAAGSRMALGNPLPTYRGSFALHIDMGQSLRLSLLADWATGHKMWNGSKSVALRGGNNPRYNLLATELNLAGSDVLDGIAKEAQRTPDTPTLVPGTVAYRAAAEEFARLDPRFDANFIEDADFLKLREVAISYRPGSLVAALPVRDLVLTLSASNLLTTSKYSGADSEVNWSGTRGLERGQDFFTLQNPRTFNIALRVSL